MKDNVFFAGGHERSSSPVRYSCSFEDVSDNQLNSNSILSISVNEVMVLAEHLHLGIFMVDQDEKVCLVNDAFMGWTGLSRPFSGVTVTSLLDPDDADFYLSAFRHVLKGCRGFTQTEYKLRSNQSEFLSVTVSMMKILLGSSSVVLNVVNCITGPQKTNLFQDTEKSSSLLSRQLLTAIEEERKKIAYDLHDECGQLVAVVAMGLSSLKKSLPDNLKQSKSMCDSFTEIIEKLSEKIRSMSTELHPDMIDHCGIVSAIEFCMETVFNGVPSITWKFKSNVDKKSFGPQIDIVMYRIIQESLNNVIKHSKADHVDVSLQLKNKRLNLKIQDNGLGFDQNSPVKYTSHHCMGILGMMERAATIGGRLTIDSQPLKGTSVTVSISVPKDRR